MDGDAHFGWKPEFPTYDGPVLGYYRQGRGEQLEYQDVISENGKRASASADIAGISNQVGRDNVVPPSSQF